MSILFSDLDFFAAYVVDLIVASDSMEEYLTHFKIVLSRLTKAKLIVNKGKSKFVHTRVV